MNTVVAIIIVSALTHDNVASFETRPLTLVFRAFGKFVKSELELAERQIELLKPVFPISIATSLYIAVQTSFCF